MENWIILILCIAVGVQSIRAKFWKDQALRNKQAGEVWERAHNLKSLTKSEAG